jgi:hypothetical protein
MFSKLQETMVVFCSSVSSANGDAKHALLRGPPIQALNKACSVGAKFCHADRQGVVGNLCHLAFASVCLTRVDQIVCCDHASISVNNLFRDGDSFINKN